MSSDSSQAQKPRHIIKSHEADFLPELQRRFGNESFKPKHLGDGGVGVVYQVSRDTVVKVMLGEKVHELIQEYKQTFKQLTKQTARLENAPYDQFYVHSTFHTSHAQNHETRTPVYIYELMEYMPMDLAHFANLNMWTGREFKSILCQIMHGMNLFHSIGYVITDLKVDNVLINPVTGNVKLNDFCESYAPDRRHHHHMYTYKDFTRKDTPLEDVWRLGILILVFLKPRVKQLVETYQLQPPERNYLNMVLSASKKRKHIDTATMLAPYVSYQKHILTSYDPDKKLWKTLFPVVMQMLHGNPRKRPTVNAIITNRVFCATCFVPRTSNQSHFGSRYAGTYSPSITVDDSFRHKPQTRKSKMQKSYTTNATYETNTYNTVSTNGTTRPSFLTRSHSVRNSNTRTHTPKPYSHRTKRHRKRRRAKKRHARRKYRSSE